MKKVYELERGRIEIQTTLKATLVGTNELDCMLVGLDENQKFFGRVSTPTIHQVDLSKTIRCSLMAIWSDGVTQKVSIDVSEIRQQFAIELAAFESKTI